MSLDWRAFYADGSTFSSLEGSPADAPSDGFICAVGYDEGGKRYIMHSCNWYCWHKDQWWPFHTEDGLFNHLRKYGVYAFKTGETVTRTEFQRIMEEANQDPDFPVQGR